MEFTQAQLKRAKAAAAYWARMPGNYWVFTKFDVHDAQQTAALKLVESPEAGTTELFYAIVDAVRLLVPGYRQKNLLEIPACDSSADHAQHEQGKSGEDPLNSVAVQRRVAFLEADEQRRELAELTLAGVMNIAIAKKLGICAHTVTARQKRLLETLNEDY